MENLLFYNFAGLMNKEIKYLRDNYYSLEDVLNYSEENGKEDPILLKIKKKLSKKSLEDFKKYREYMDEKSIKYFTIDDEIYPESLKLIDDYPFLLYYKGSPKFSKFNIAVVGSRKATDYGKSSLRKIIGEFRGYNIAIVSGLALGIDKYSHEAALDTGLYTAAVLGQGIDLIYPQSNRKTYEKIVENGGIILSEYPLGTPPLPYNFPYRNRIISGLSRCVVIIEAKEKSGTLITASYALDQDRDIFCLPGNITSPYSMGTNKLIKDGAGLLTSAKDIIEFYDELKFEKKKKKKAFKDISSLSDKELAIYNILMENPTSSDELARKLGVAIEDISSSLTMLELRDIVCEISSIWYIK